VPPPQPPRLETSLERVLGIEDLEFDGESVAKARLPVIDAIKQPFGIVHGGAYAALAETVCSWATYMVVGPENVALGQSNETTFMRPASRGVIEAVATARHRGRTSWVWDVEMSDSEGRLCALTRMLIAVRPMPAEPPPQD
jgi:1,4-dihydroxy-2-naphthoyl-CoA hydrolase